MDQKTRKPGILERTAELIDLPADYLAGLPRVEVIGDKELHMSNHKGILAYGDTEIHVSGGTFVVKISGHDLNPRSMTGLELCITGRIEQIQFA